MLQPGALSFLKTLATQSQVAQDLRSDTTFILPKTDLYCAHTLLGLFDKLRIHNESGFNLALTSRGDYNALDVLTTMRGDAVRKIHRVYLTPEMSSYADGLQDRMEELVQGQNQGALPSYYSLSRDDRTTMRTVLDHGERRANDSHGIAEGSWWVCRFLHLCEKRV